MAQQAPSLIDRLRARFAGAQVSVVEPRGEVTLEVPSADWHAVAVALRDEFGFEHATDLCGVDYLGYGSDEWDTSDVSSQGFSRGVEGKGAGRFAWGEFPSHETADGAQPDALPGSVLRSSCSCVPTSTTSSCACAASPRASRCRWWRR